MFQFITGLLHGLSFFAEPQPANDTERQLQELLNNYKSDMGAGFHRSVGELFISISACFTLLFLFGGLINWYLLRKKVSNDLLSGMVSIQVIIFGICFVVMLLFAFLPPIVLSGMVFLTLLLGWVTIRKTV